MHCKVGKQYVVKEIEVGQRFGSRVVLETGHRKQLGKHEITSNACLCLCDCGEVSLVTHGYLRSIVDKTVTQCKTCSELQKVIREEARNRKKYNSPSGVYHG
jgi:hypothetical protein